VETVEHAVGYQPDNRVWFYDESQTAVEEKTVSYKKWIDRLTLDRTMWRNRFGGGFEPVVRQNTERRRLTSCKRLEYERLQKIAHKIHKDKKGIQTTA
jgi:hypothetical protein